MARGALGSTELQFDPRLLGDDAVHIIVPLEGYQPTSPAIVFEQENHWPSSRISESNEKFKYSTILCFNLLRIARFRRIVEGSPPCLLLGPYSTSARSKTATSIALSKSLSWARYPWLACPRRSITTVSTNTLRS